MLGAVGMKVEKKRKFYSQHTVQSAHSKSSMSSQ